MGGLSNLISGVGSVATKSLSQVGSLAQSLHNNVSAITPPPVREMVNWGANAAQASQKVNLDNFRLPGLPIPVKLPDISKLPNSPTLPMPDPIAKLPSILDVPGGPKFPPLPNVNKTPVVGLPELLNQPPLAALAEGAKLSGLAQLLDLAKMPGLPKPPEAPAVTGAPNLGETKLPDMPDVPVQPIPHSMGGTLDVTHDSKIYLPAYAMDSDLPASFFSECTNRSDVTDISSRFDIPGTPQLNGARQAPMRQAQAADTVELAEMASDVYSTNANPPAGWRVASPEDLATLGLSPSQLNIPSANFFARVYTTGEGANQQFVVSFRGTEITSGRDWLTNAGQAAGLPTPHYNAALAIGRQIAESGATNVVMTGHSLGGGLASAAALASGCDAQTFNASGLSDATIEKANDIRENAGAGGPGDIRAYYVRGEILSLLQDGGDRIIGSLLGGGLLGPVGSALGSLIDAPEAYGTRIELDPVRPQGTSFWNDNPFSRHNMDWVLASLPN